MSKSPFPSVPLTCPYRTVRNHLLETLLLILATGFAVPCSADILYVTNTGDNTIERFTPGGVSSVFASTGLNGPLCLAFDTAGNLFVVNTGDETIEKFTPGGVGSLFASTGLSGARGLAFDSAGNLYVAN